MTILPRPTILLDVGSTNSRAWLVREGAIVDARSIGVGVRDSVRAGASGAVHATVASLIRALAPAGEPFDVAGAGMITSAQGLIEVPHVAAPASAADLARAAIAFPVPGVVATSLLLVPGVRTTAAGPSDDDVMRGEETLALGLLEGGALQTGDVLLNAGSHWKLIHLDDRGRVAGSRTSLGGEVVHAVQTATLLSASLPDGPLMEPLPEWLESGAAASARDGLLRALFAVRLLDQRGGTTPAQRFAWMVGACISDDLRALVAGGHLRPAVRVRVSGPGAVPSAWAHLLAREGFAADVLDSDTVARAFVAGLCQIIALRHRPRE